MWVESSLQIGDRPVGLQIELLDEDSKERVAAVLAWLTLEAVRNQSSADGIAWHEYVGEVMERHVAFFVQGQDADAFDVMWWNEAVGYAFLEFVGQNALAGRVNRHLTTLRSMAAETRVES